MNQEKNQVIEMIRSLPDDSSIDDIMQELCFRVQVDHGLAELDAGKGIAHSAMKKRFAKWLAK